MEGISSKADCEELLCGRVKSLRDVVELKFEVDTERGEEHRRETGTGKGKKREGWICPITAKVLGPGVKSVYLVPCGHVFSEEAVRQLKGDKCLQVSSRPFRSCPTGAIWLTGAVQRVLHRRQHNPHPPTPRNR